MTEPIDNRIEFPNNGTKPCSACGDGDTEQKYHKHVTTEPTQAEAAREWGAKFEHCDVSKEVAWINAHYESGWDTRSWEYLHGQSDGDAHGLPEMLVAYAAHCQQEDAKRIAGLEDSMRRMGIALTESIDETETAEDRVKDLEQKLQGYAGVWWQEEIDTLKQRVAELEAAMPHSGDGSCDHCGRVPSINIPTSLCHECRNGVQRAVKAEAELAAAMQIVKDACDRDGCDLMWRLVLPVASNAMFWRNTEIAKLRNALAALRETGCQLPPGRKIVQLDEAFIQLYAGKCMRIDPKTLIVKVLEGSHAQKMRTC